MASRSARFVPRMESVFMTRMVQTPRPISRRTSKLWTTARGYAGRIMSNQPENPWASQDPNWRPSQFGDAQGRDPRQPFGQQAPQQPGYGYQELQPPRRPNRSMWVVLAAVGIVAALIIGMQFFGAPAPEEPQPTQTASGTAAPSPTRTGELHPLRGQRRRHLRDRRLHLERRPPHAADPRRS